MNLDLERQLVAYVEVLDEAAPPVPAPIDEYVAAKPGISYRRGLAIAAAAALVVLVVIGSLILLAPMADEQPVVDDPVTTTVRTTTTTIPPVDGVIVEGFVVSQVLQAGLVSDLAIADDGTIWAVVLDTDFTGPMYYGLWDGLGNPDWALAKQTADGWEVVTGEGDPSVPDELASIDWFVGPQLLGFRPDGGAWFHDLPAAPEGPFFLWEYNEGEWIDHTAAAFLPGDPSQYDFQAPVSMGCCPMGIDDDGVVWVHSEDTTNADWENDVWPVEVVSRYDGEWETTNGRFPNELTRDNPYVDGIERDGVRWTLGHDWERTGTWTVRYGDGESQRFPVDYDVLEANLTCSPHQGVFDIDTESVIASDGALWTVWPCIGVTRIDPDDGSMTLITEGLPNSDMWRIEIGPDDTIWIAGTGGIARVDPEV